METARLIQTQASQDIFYKNCSDGLSTFLAIAGFQYPNFLSNLRISVLKLS